jgi:hypothetical protein
MIDASKYDRNKHPGKFEGESPATEYFYEQMMNGDGETIYADYETNEYDEKEYNEEDGPHAELFHINAEESEAFNLPIGFWFMLTEDSQGFVMGLG